MPFGAVLLVMVHVVLPRGALGCAVSGELLPLNPGPLVPTLAWRNTEHAGTDAGKIQTAGAGL